MNNIRKKHYLAGMYDGCVQMSSMKERMALE